MNRNHHLLAILVGSLSACYVLIAPHAILAWRALVLLTAHV